MGSNAAVTTEPELMNNPHLRIIFTGEDEVLIKHSARSPGSRIVRDEGRTKLLGRLLRITREPVSKETIRGALNGSQIVSEDIDNLIEYLLQEAILIPAHQDTFSAYSASVLKGNNNLKERSVGLIGLGYLGSRIAEELAKFGIGQISGCDGRTVQNEDFDKHYFRLGSVTPQLNQTYDDLLKEKLHSHGYESFKPVSGPMEDKPVLKSIFDESDCVIASLEVFSPRLLHSINEVALESSKPWLSVIMDGSEAHIGPLYIPHRTCCYSEMEAQYAASAIGVKDEYLTYLEAMDQQGLEAQHLALPAYLESVCGMASISVARYLLTEESHLVGRCVRYDFERLSVDHDEIMRLPRCPACAPYKPYRHTFL